MNNTFCWVDIPVSNLDRAINFYSAMLATSIQKVSEHGFEFGLFPHKDGDVSGCLSVMDRKPSKDGALVYLNVEGQLDETIKRAKAQGSTILADKEQIGPWGYRALIVDSEGNAIALYSKEA